MRTRTEAAIMTALDLLFMVAVGAAVIGLFALVGCRKPPAEPVPSDAATIPLDAAPGDAGPAIDGTVSDCVGRPQLTCGLLAAEAEPGTWEAEKDGALDTVRDVVASPIQLAGIALCGQTTGGVVHYLGNDAAVETIFEDRLSAQGWTFSDTVEDSECATRQDYEKDGLLILLRTRRAQGSVSLQVRLAP